MSKITGWDRFLMSLAPRWGLERVRVRAVAESLARHYEAASFGRRTEGWARSASDADLTIAPALTELRMHSRDLLRNNSWARRGQRVIANNTVGWGIRPKAVGDDTAANAKAMSLWKTWASSTECESEGRHTFYGLQHLAMKSIVSDGEVLFRRRPRYVSDGLTLPLQIQVLEADFLDHTKRSLSSDAGGPIIQGVEFDKLGRRAAYWIFEAHPGSGRLTTPSKRMLASEILHVCYTERSAQTRGVSWLGSAIVNLKDLDDYDDAELMKQKIAACFAAFVTDMDGQGTMLGSADSRDDLVDSLEPGMIEHLPPGKQVTFGNPPGVTSDSLPARTLRRVAAGLGTTYEDLTGDYSNVNFSSARMARIAHWANVNDWQQNMVIPLLCAGVWDWAMSAAVALGELPEAPGAEWTVPPMPMIEPDKEGLALQRLVRVGAMTPSEMVREQGSDPEAHWNEYAADLKVLDAKGIKLDADVRAVSQAGQVQVEPADPSEAAPKDPPAPLPKKREEPEVRPVETVEAPEALKGVLRLVSGGKAA